MQNYTYETVMEMGFFEPCEPMCENPAPNQDEVFYDQCKECGLFHSCMQPNYEAFARALKNTLNYLS